METTWSTHPTDSDPSHNGIICSITKLEATDEAKQHALPPETCQLSTDVYEFKMTLQSIL
jgi:hypothetical protein